MPICVAGVCESAEFFFEPGRGRNFSFVIVESRENIIKGSLEVHEIFCCSSKLHGKVKLGVL